MPNCYSASQSIFTACAIAARYPNRLPNWRELVDQFGMSKATAYRWINAMSLARLGAPP